MAKVSPDGRLAWSTCLGGLLMDEGKALATDGAGNLYMAGVTQSSGWLSGGYDTTFNGGKDAFVVKLGADGQCLWGTYLGGRNDDEASGIALDRMGNLCVVGTTYSTGWVAGGYDTSKPDNSIPNGFLAWLTPTGQFLWSTYLGGAGSDQCSAVAVDDRGVATVTGKTYSTGWTSGEISGALNGGGISSWCADAFILQLSPGGRPLWSSYLGGVNSDAAWAIALGAPGDLWVAGETDRPAWYTGACDTTPKGDQDGFVAKIHDTRVPFTTGTLQVTLGPAAAITAGAKWRRVGEGDWRDGATTASMPAGFCAIEFKSAPGWVTPPLQRMAITEGQTTSTCGTFIPAGALRVTLDPPQAVAAGAGWRRSGDQNWLGDGAVTNGLTSGTITLECKPLPDWSTPAPRTITIRTGETTETTISYEHSKSELAWSESFWLGIYHEGRGMTVDGAGNIYVTGNLCIAKPWWIQGGYNTTFTGIEDSFLIKLAPDGRVLWGTYLGGSLTNPCEDVAVDAQGQVYVIGTTQSSGWLSGGYDTTLGGGQDAFVVKLSANGQYLWGTCLGGTNVETGSAIAVDAAGNPYVTGTTRSANWIADGFDTEPGYLSWPIGFVARLAPDTGCPVWSSYIKGDDVTDIAVDHAGDICVTGSVRRAMSYAFLNDPKGYQDGYVIKMNNAGQFLWGKYLGGFYDEYCTGIAIDKDDNILLTGNTESTGWITGGYDTQLGITPLHSWDFPETDGFVVKLASDGRELWSTYLGGDKIDSGSKIAVNPAGEIFVAGYTLSPGWIQGGLDTTFDDTGDYPNYSYDGFVVKLAADGSHVWSTYQGGPLDDKCLGLATVSPNIIYLLGSSNKSDLVISRLDDLTPDVPRGAIHVTIEPPEAERAGARWRRVGSSAWRDSGTTATNVPASLLGLEFLSTPNWIAPPVQTVMVCDGQTTDVVAHYLRRTGTLQVTIDPPEAVTFGAGWRRQGTLPWMESGACEAGVPTGWTMLQFGAVPGFDPPLSVGVDVSENQTLLYHATYTRRPRSNAVDQRAWSLY